MNIHTVFCATMVSMIFTLSVLAEEQPARETVRAVVDQGGKQRVEILGGGYFFKPDHIIVTVNVPIELVVKRESGIVPHTFVLKLPESGIMIDESLSTEAKSIVFTPTAVGKYTFYCRNRLLFFKSHEEKGMKGVLEVVP